jgi:hypothetical protein
MSAPGDRAIGGHLPAGRSPGLEPERPRQAWIGIDVSSEPAHRTPRGVYPLVAMAALVVLASLAVAAVRIDLIRTRYAVSAALERENELLEAQRQLIVRRRQLRDPVELAVQARERGFRPPAHVVSLPDPTIGDLEAIVAPQPVLATPSVAAVSAGPGDGSGSGSEWQ